MNSGRSPSGLGRHERFARAVEARQEGDLAKEFAEEFAAVDSVRAIAPVLGPDQTARQRMRERILAAAGPEAAEPEAGAAVQPDIPRAPEPLPRSGWHGKRFAVALAASLALVFSLTGMGLLMADNALPGEALYGLKRTAEAASVGLAFGEESRAFKYLEHAATRVDEMEILAGTDPAVTEAPADAYHTALADLDADATAGSRGIIDLATRGDIGRLDVLRDWAVLQRDRLDTLVTRLPVVAQHRTEASADLLTRIGVRAAALSLRADCQQITTGDFDEVGALPATADCVRADGPTTLTSPSSVASVNPNANPGAPSEASAGAGTDRAHLPKPSPTPALPPLVASVIVPMPAPATIEPPSLLPLPTPPSQLEPPLPGLPPVLPGGIGLTIG